MLVKEMVELLKKQPQNNKLVMMCKDHYVVRHMGVMGNGNRLTIIGEKEYTFEKET